MKPPSPPVYTPLAQTEQVEHLLEDGVKITKSTRSFDSPRILTLVHFAVLYLSVVVLFSMLWIEKRSGAQLNGRCQDPTLALYSPANDVVEYETVEFIKAFPPSHPNTPYMGFPDDEIDERWTSLYSFGISAISPEEADKLLVSTLPVPGNDSLQLVELDVFHQLHCLNDIRKALYPDRYPGHWKYKDDGTVDYRSVQSRHWDHCVDALRQTLMCHADISPLPFHFNEITGTRAPVLATTHMCRNFDKIRQWAIEHMAPAYDPHAP